MRNNLKARLDTENTPKKILACDGGGIRGLISVEILSKLEHELRLQTGNSSLLLCDYFDFVCGTSTGAIIAACIASGMSIDEIRGFYLDSGELMFKRSKIYERLRFKYDDEPLAAKIREVLNAKLRPRENDEGRDATLGSRNLRTLLMMVLRNHSTDSPWPIWNNPNAKYNQRDRNDCNLNLPLWQLVRASTAAPTYFPPETVTLGKGDDAYEFIFVDGGVTTYNNPAYLAFQLATAAPYELKWKTGEDKMLIVSIGTGGAAMERLEDKAGDLWLGSHAATVPSALMNAASAGWDMACRNLGNCRFGADIDREFRSMSPVEKFDGPNSSIPKLFTYVRYNPGIDAKGLKELGLSDIDPRRISKLDSTDAIGDLQRVGQTYAAASVDVAGHLDGFF